MAVGAAPRKSVSTYPFRFVPLLPPGPAVRLRVARGSAELAQACIRRSIQRNCRIVVRNVCVFVASTDQHGSFQETAGNQSKPSESGLRLGLRGSSSRRVVGEGPRRLALKQVGISTDTRHCGSSTGLQLRNSILHSDHLRAHLFHLLLQFADDGFLSGGLGESVRHKYCCDNADEDDFSTHGQFGRILNNRSIESAITRHACPCAHLD